MRIYLAGFESYDDGVGLGLLSQQTEAGGTCTMLSDTAIDDMPTAMKVTRIFGFLGYAFHSLALITVIALEAFCTYQKSALLLWKCVRLGVISAFICSILLFATFFQETCTTRAFGIGFKCAPGPTGIVAIINVFMLVALIVVSQKTDAPTQPTLCRGGSRSSPEQEDPVTAAELPIETAASLETKKCDGQQLATTVAELHSSASNGSACQEVEV